MSIRLVRAVLSNVNGVQADESVNQFVFNTSDPDASLVAAVEQFYNVPTGTGHPLASFLSNELSRVAGMAQTEVYDITTHLDGTPHGSPELIHPFTLGASDAVAALPEQVAATLSYHAGYSGVLESGPMATRPSDARARKEGAPATHSAKTRPKSSLRGRIYLGPLNTDVIAGGVPHVDPAGSFAASMKAAAIALLAAEPGWCVWSRVTASTANIIGGWVDHDFAVVRRRKPKHPSNVVWP